MQVCGGWGASHLSSNLLLFWASTGPRPSISSPPVPPPRPPPRVENGQITEYRGLNNISVTTYFGPDIFFNSTEHYSFSIDFDVREGWKSSGRPVGKMSINPGTLTPPWCRVMTKNLITHTSGMSFPELLFNPLYPVTKAREYSNQIHQKTCSLICTLD